MTRCLAAALLLTCLAFVAGCGDGDGEDPLVVSAAASMTEALEACAPAFEDAEGAEVRLSFAGSDELAAQIRQGAKVDAYAAANVALPDELHAEGLLGAPVEFATNEFVLAVPRDSRIDSLDDLTRTGMTVVIGSDSVPIGAYTRETLAKLPPAKERKVLANVRSEEPDVKGIVGKLTQGAADAGFVYVTDVNAAAGALRAVRLSRRLDPSVTYAAGVPTAADERELGRSFVAGLRDGLCAGVLRDAGFGPPPR